MMNKPCMVSIIAVATLLFLALQYGKTQSGTFNLKFDMGNGLLQPGWLPVTCDTDYDSVRGYGFLSDSQMENVTRAIDNPVLQDFCTSSRPFRFIVNVPEGNYSVRLTFGDALEETCTTVKAESRRLMLESVETVPGGYITKTILVNVRTPVITPGLTIRLKPREINFMNWDHKLELEFNNSTPCINAIEISKAENVRTVFLAGNSTVVDQEYEPWCSWGQMITSFLTDDVVVVNLAESGETLKSFKGENRLKKLLEMLTPGDYVFIEFGHNDQKPQSPDYVKPFEGYKDELKDYIMQIKDHGGRSVLVSPVQRRKFDSTGRIINTHGDYPFAMHETADEEGVPFIDLNGMSKVLFETLGEEGSKRAFVHYPANSFPGQEAQFADNSHFSPYGAYELAKCILQGICDTNIDLKECIINFDSYDPGKPDPYEDFKVPTSPPPFQQIKPEGN
jgi:lysophospholipase L1-like esterase